LASDLVSRADLEVAVSQLRAGGGTITEAAITDRQLADKLIEMGRLNSYQAVQLLAGNSSLHLGPYRILDEIGRGGMGEVYKAEHPIMGRTVAIKVLPKSKSTPAATASFMREIRAQAQLDHRHLVRAFDAGHDRNVHYLVTEFVPGMDLRRYVRSRGPLDMHEAASIISQAADGLQHAHERGLVHRDVKPGNLLVTPEGLTKVSDLGLAGWLQEDDPEFLSGKIVGTADYLAPEQILDPGAVAPAGDIYSLGCTLYYAVTGKVPFPGGTTAEKAHHHCNDTPWKPNRFNPSLSDEFVEVISQMMEKDPTKRVQTAAEVIKLLAPWAGPMKGSVEAEIAPGPATRQTIPLPPPPDRVANNIDEFEELDDLLPSDSGGHSQVSQGTDPVASADHETIPDGLPRRLLTAQKRALQSLGGRIRETPLLVWLLLILIPAGLATVIAVLIAMIRAMSNS
jgi:serine/threonine protein kinase